MKTIIKTYKLYSLQTSTLITKHIILIFKYVSLLFFSKIFFGINNPCIDHGIVSPLGKPPLAMLLCRMRTGLSPAAPHPVRPLANVSVKAPNDGWNVWAPVSDTDTVLGSWLRLVEF